MWINEKLEYKKILDQKKLELEELDYKLLKNRDKKRYILIKVAPRTISTKFGILTFNRRIYMDNTKSKDKYLSLLEEKINLPKYVKIHPDLVEEIKSYIGDGKRYRDIQDLFPHANLSQMSISNIFKSVKNEEKRLHVNNKIALPNKQTIYIFLDDTFVNLDRLKVRNKIRKIKRHKDVKVRVATFCTGYAWNNNSRKRKKLANKKIVYWLGKEESLTTEQLSQRLLEHLEQFYTNVENCHLVVGGDGAGWIKNVASWLHADYILDRYHAIKKLRTTFYNNTTYYIPTYSILHTMYNIPTSIVGKDLFYITKDLFKNGKYEILYAILQELATDEVAKYFKNNKTGIINQGAAWNIGVSAECEISRLVKSALGYGSKIYSHIVFKNILNERAFKINNNLCV
ncbi:Mbov_0401 family ICE element transposase-like protein [Williamsoniiplasma lucivorax]|uniref:Transposase n=1 Tax=Williamsoniiplasma lucivorax TaxID=209274 RepID=A0A2S5RF66_9MOLU|nr:UPF0236 family protein [Williamsoniiplasma lucivorax]PPE05969.1 hypothetical protein ELUCI_v1c02600 [Williamsoniiplasma lucivorax]